MGTRAGPRLGAVQAAVYAAEAEGLAHHGMRWTRLAAAQAYADTLVGREWFAERWPAFGRCHVERRGSGARYSTCAALGPSAFDSPASGPHALGPHDDGSGPAGAVVLLAPGHLTQAVLLHELAHVLAGSDSGHSAPFLATQLQLVRNEMGVIAYAEYREALLRRPELAEHHTYVATFGSNVPT